MAAPASTATAAALKTRREMDDVCVMVESSKFIDKVRWSEFWRSKDKTGTTDFVVSNYRIIYVGLALTIKKPTGAMGSGGQLPGETLCLAVSGFAVRRDIETLALILFAHPQTDRQVNDFVGNEGDHAGPDDGRQHSLELDPDGVSHRH